jgi:hypothetical protein
MRKRTNALVVVLSAVALSVPAGQVVAGAATDRSSASSQPATFAEGTGEFVVFYKDGADAGAARGAVAKAGGTVVDEITELGIARVSTDDSRFSSRLVASGLVKGVIRNHSVGADHAGAVHRFAEERALEDRATYAASSSADAGHPDTAT